MITKKWLVAGMLAVLLAVPAPSFAHDACHKEGGMWGKEHGIPDLSDEQRTLLHDTMKTSVEKNKPLFEQMKKLHEKMHAIVAADTFDSQAFIKVTGQMQKLHERLMKDRIAAFASIAGQFSPDQREAIIRRFGKHHGMHHKGHHGHMMEHDGALSSGSSAAPSSSPDLAYPPYPKR